MSAREAATPINNLRDVFGSFSQTLEIENRPDRPGEILTGALRRLVETVETRQWNMDHGCSRLARRARNSSKRIISNRSTLKSVIQTSPGLTQQRSKPRRGIQNPNSTTAPQQPTQSSP